MSRHGRLSSNVIVARATVMGAQIALACAAPSVAYAGESITAQALFEEAKKLMADERFAEACPKLEESLKLDPGIGTRFNLADCNEHRGRLASAWAGYLEVAAEARAAGQEARATAARARASRVEPKLTTLTIVVRGEPPPAFTVKRDDVTIGPSAWGTAIPIDPGEHTVTASTGDEAPWQAHVHVAADAAPERLVVTVPLPGAQPVASPSLDGAHDAPPSSVGGGQRTAAIVTAAVGVATIGVGLGFGVHSWSQRDASASHCVGNACDADGVAMRQRAVDAGTVSTWLVGVGAVAAATGTILWLSALRAQSAGASVGAAPMVAAGGAGLSLQGAW